MLNSSRLKSLTLQNRTLGALLLLGLFMLILQYPLSRLDELISERQQSFDSVAADMAEKWGGEQSVAGPFLLVPYRVTRQEELQSGILLPTEERRVALFLPTDLQLHAVAEPEIRYRGLYQVPLYRATLELNARFDAPDLAALGLNSEQMLWQEARLLVHVSDVKALTGSLTAVWNEEPLEVQPGTTSASSDDGFQFPVALTAPDQSHHFNLHFQVNGSNRLFAAPTGKRSVLHMSGQWPAPNFQGEWLPSTRKVNAQGFSADWDIPFIAKGMPMQWEGASADLRLENSRWVGVKLQPEMDAYRKNQRATKYQLLFLLLIFGFFWLFQWLTGIGVHPLQYLLIGAAMCVFYLLLLSLSEHLGFFTAYLLASAAVVMQIGLYARSVLQSWKRAGGMALMLAGLLGYLGSLLQEQDFALLYGSLGVFVALSVVMYLTRRLQLTAPVQTA
ncbi:MAG TPA: cell envelope integrity protein CreD [Dongiaceae bacterium]|nr:cell envelope integrity protein CreD [Dongiaceae bacterium]